MNYLLLGIYFCRVIFNIKILEASRKSYQSNTLPSNMCVTGYSACVKINNTHWPSKQLFWVFIHVVLLLLTLYCWHNIAILHIRKLGNQRLKNLLNIIHPGRGWTLKRTNHTTLASPFDAVIKPLTQKQPWGEQGFSLLFQVRVHHWEKSRQELKVGA